MIERLFEVQCRQERRAEPRESFIPARQRILLASQKCDHRIVAKAKSTDAFGEQSQRCLRLCSQSPDVDRARKPIAAPRTNGERVNSTPTRGSKLPIHIDECYSMVIVLPGRPKELESENGE